MPKNYRLIFLGAGFSRPAGLPLGDELFQEVRKAISVRHGSSNTLEDDLDSYVEYLNKCEGRIENPDTINLEDFLSFLDVEHFLWLKGGDTWSYEGNQSQLMVRSGIAKVLNDKTPKIIPEEYRHFVKKLNPGDVIFTFNYDTLLEQTMELENIPYRLFPHRYKNAETGILDNSKEEVSILKLHGSIDWFDRTSYERMLKILHQSNLNPTYDHPVFGPNSLINLQSLTDGPRLENDPLSKIYRVEDIKPLGEEAFYNCAPLILSPSHRKILYSQPLREFWSGLSQYGGYNFSLGVIGYSLPDYDDYVRQILYHVFNNYTQIDPKLDSLNLKKTDIRILDYRSNPKSQNELRKQYRFANLEKTEFHFDGFNLNNTDWFLEI